VSQKQTTKKSADHNNRTKAILSFVLLLLGKFTCSDLRSAVHDLYTISYENLTKQIQSEGLPSNESKKLAQDIIVVKAKYLFIVSLYSLQISGYGGSMQSLTGKE